MLEDNTMFTFSLTCFTILFVISRTSPCCYTMPENPVNLAMILFIFECLFTILLWSAKRIGLLLWTSIKFLLYFILHLLQANHNKQVSKKILEKYSNL